MRTAREVQHHREDGRVVPEPKHRIVFVHSPSHVALAPRLNFDMHENELRLPLERPDLGHDVRFAAPTFRQIGEKLLVQRALRREIEPRGDLWKEEL